MKFQNSSLKNVLNGRTSRNQYAPYFFKVEGIMTSVYVIKTILLASIFISKSDLKLFFLLHNTNFYL